MARRDASSRAWNYDNRCASGIIGRTPAKLFENLRLLLSPVSGRHDVGLHGVMGGIGRVAARDRTLEERSLAVVAAVAARAEDDGRPASSSGCTRACRLRPRCRWSRPVPRGLHRRHRSRHTAAPVVPPVDEDVPGLVGSQLAVASSARKGAPTRRLKRRGASRRSAVGFRDGQSPSG